MKLKIFNALTSVWFFIYAYLLCDGVKSRTNVRILSKLYYMDNMISLETYKIDKYVLHIQQSFLDSREV